MKKQNLINLVKYHVEKKDEAFATEVMEIAKDFDKHGDEAVAQYLMELISNVNFYVPQGNYKNLNYLRKLEYSTKPLILPDAIEEDVIGVTKAIGNKSGLSKFLFYGEPGTGKTESAYQIARLLDRDILSVDFEQLVDSRLGETAKNVVRLFDEINHLQYGRVIVVFDEIGIKAARTFEFENLLNFINTTIDLGKSSIYMSNLTAAELNDRLGSRLYSRILNMSVDIELHGADKRGL